ncbi:phospholipase D3-like [Copidosoma floridanum]|uniref:phospholipase D3-like n=1 Tax=Copidosoma floridanum TaxID=29053 RepID=UPI000C6FAE35|nr:phospholipase D3-like [Copidosoma floridanum]
MSFFGWGRGARETADDHPGRNLQDGLLQIASQACHILVQVNNTQNVSYGGSNRVTNVAYSKNSEGLGVASSSLGASGSGVYSKNVDSRLKDQDVVVLLPPSKSRTPRIRHKLATVSENARLDVNSPAGDEDFDFWDQTGFMLKNDVDDPFDGRWGTQDWCRPSYIPISIILVLIVLVVLLPLLDNADKQGLHGRGFGNDSEMSCMRDCDISLVESIPRNMSYANGSVVHRSTYDTWLELIALARKDIEIASLYWTMNREDLAYADDSAREGEEVFQELLRAGRDRRINLKIAQDTPSQLSPDVDTETLAKRANAQVRSLNFAALLGGGVLHTKMWIIDRTHVYVGSANMDWRSLTQVKELGLVAFNCSCMARDLAKIFEVYWYLGKTGKIPNVWPKPYTTKINVKTPMAFELDGNNYTSFFASSPTPFLPEGRTSDLDSIIHCIEKAEKFIYISVMDYFPLTIYSPKIKFWPVIDNALRTAAIERKVNVRLLISKWKHSRASEDHFLKSIEDLTDSYSKIKIEVRRFIVPTNPELDKIPFARVNHNKYMVTDIAAYIGTSNWSGDYFINTAGIGLVFEDASSKNQNSIRQQLEDVFERDWNSQYSYSLSCTFKL